LHERNAKDKNSKPKENVTKNEKEEERDDDSKDLEKAKEKAKEKSLKVIQAKIQRTIPRARVPMKMEEQNTKDPLWILEILPMLLHNSDLVKPLKEEDFEGRTL